MQRDIILTWLAYIWSATLSFLFAPIYVHMLGVTQYGIISFFVTLTSLCVIFDLGFSQTFTRETARLSKNMKVSNLADLTATLERVNWGIGSVIFIVGLIFCIFTADQSWRHNLILMMIAMAVRWPVSLYCGGLLGVGKAKEYATFVAVSSTLRVVGVIAVLSLWGKSAEVFIIWQIFIGLGQSFWSRSLLLRHLPANVKGRFSKSILIQSWRYTVQVSAVLILCICFWNTDKFLLANLLSLTDYGYYSFAVNVAAALGTITTPIAMNIQPRVIAAHAQGFKHEFQQNIQKGQFFIGLILLPSSMILYQYLEPILNLWTRQPELSARTASILQVYIPGQVCYIFAQYWLNLQIGCAKTKFALSSYFLAILFLSLSLSLSMPVGGVVLAANLWLYATLGLLLAAFCGMRSLLSWKNLLALVTNYIIIPAALTLLVLKLLSLFAPTELLLLHWALFLIVATGLVVAGIVMFGYKKTFAQN